MQVDRVYRCSHVRGALNFCCAVRRSLDTQLAALAATRDLTRTWLVSRRP